MGLSSGVEASGAIAVSVVPSEELLLVVSGSVTLVVSSSVVMVSDGAASLKVVVSVDGSGLAASSLIPSLRLPDEPSFPDKVEVPEVKLPPESK